MKNIKSLVQIFPELQDVILKNCFVVLTENPNFSVQEVSNELIDKNCDLSNESDAEEWNIKSVRKTKRCARFTIL